VKKVTATVKQQSGLNVLKPYTPGKPIEEVQREYGLTDVIKLASNENPIGASPKVLAAIAAALPRLNYYPDAQAYGLCHAIAAKHGVTADMVRVGNGADGLIRELCVSYLDEGDELLTSMASFPVYDISASIMRARIVKTPLKDLRFDLQAMADEITDRTKLIFICNPNNPTGNYVNAEEVSRFMERVPDHALVVFDEAYYEFALDGGASDYPDTMAYVREGRKNVFVMRTFSKAHGIAGIRIGYAFAQPEVLAPMRACSESFPVNLLAQVAGEVALDDDEFVQQTIETNRQGREYLYREFTRLGLTYPPSHTNFILIHVGPQAGQVFQKLLEVGVIVRPCKAYELPEYLRITVGTPEQNRRLIAALGAILGCPEPAPVVAVAN
jgi:histidinol-phosphate aminotransferase